MGDKNPFNNRLPCRNARFASHSRTAGGFDLAAFTDSSYFRLHYAIDRQPSSRCRMAHNTRPNGARLSSAKHGPDEMESLANFSLKYAPANLPDSPAFYVKPLFSIHE